MAYADLPLDVMRSHVCDQPEPADLDEFWADTLDEARTFDRAPVFDRVATGLPLIDTYDVSFPGWGGSPIAGWLHVPAGTTTPLPCVVTYIGYGSGRGLPHDSVIWALAGYAMLVMDTRGQGSDGRAGDTPDPAGSGPAYPGVMSRGVGSPETYYYYYYRRLITDAVRAVDAARAFELVEPTRIVVAGGSQGGGLSIAAAALAPDVFAAMPDVPFLCDFPRALWIGTEEPYGELVGYLATHRGAAETVLRTLSYVDGAHLARRAIMPALFSVGLMDPVCPPSTVYSAYNAWSGTKQMREYGYNGHEGGASVQVTEQLGWLRELLGS